MIFQQVNLIHLRVRFGGREAWFNSPTLGSETRIQGLPWDLIPFIGLLQTSWNKVDYQSQF